MAIFASTTTFKKVHRPCKHYSNIVNNSLHHVNFSSLFFSSFSGYVFIPYHIWKCTQTMYTVTCQQQSTSCLFFFSLFSSLYGYIFALITILKNMHRPWFPSYFFHLKMQNLLYLEICSVHSSHWILVLFHSGDYSGVNTRISLLRKNGTLCQDILISNIGHDRSSGCGIFLSLSAFMDPQSCGSSDFNIFTSTGLWILRSSYLSTSLWLLRSSYLYLHRSSYPNLCILWSLFLCIHGSTDLWYLQILRS